VAEAGKTPRDIIEKCSAFEICEKRSVSDDYCELVFLNKETEKWNKVLTEVLGPAVKPRKIRPSKEDSLITKNFGGVYDDQVLYKKEFGGINIIAMLWPWQDGVHTTLKIALLKA